MTSARSNNPLHARVFTALTLFQITDIIQMFTFMALIVS